MPNNKFTVLMWNVAGIRNHITSIKFKNIIPYLNTHLSDINCLQELFFAKERLKRVSIKKQNVLIPPNNNGSTKEFNDAVIITKYLILEHGFIRFKNVNDSTNVTWATIKINNKKIRIYNCHFEVTNVGIKERLSYIRKIIGHSKKVNLPTIICGDLNTTIPKKGLSRFITKMFHKPQKESFIINGEYINFDERYVFLKEIEKYGFKDTLDINNSTYCLPYIKLVWPKLKLDWFLTKGITAKIELVGPFISDHKPYNIICEIKK